MIVYAPLPPGSPFLFDDTRCGICHQRFQVGERVMLQPLDLSSATAQKQGLPLHARCVLVGREVRFNGRIERIEGIEEGAGVMAPVKLAGGQRANFSQVGIPANE